MGRAGGLHQGGGLCLIVIACLSASAARAGQPAQAQANRSGAPTFEVWAGADGADAAWSVHGGMVAALFSDVRENGARVRTGASFGGYAYSRPYFDPFTRRMTTAEFRGRTWSTDFLLGYQQAFGPVIVKAYAGYTEESHEIRPGSNGPLQFDEDNTVQGRRQGAKVVLETWTTLSKRAFLQLDGSWSQPFESYSSRARLGYRVTPAWSVGVEASAYGSSNHLGGRSGAFVRFEWAGGEVSVAAGAQGDEDAISAAYGSVSALVRF